MSLTTPTLLSLSMPADPRTSRRLASRWDIPPTTSGSRAVQRLIAAIRRAARHLASQNRSRQAVPSSSLSSKLNDRPSRTGGPSRSSIALRFLKLSMLQPSLSSPCPLRRAFEPLMGYRLLCAAGMSASLQVWFNSFLSRYITRPPRCSAIGEPDESYRQRRGACHITTARVVELRGRSIPDVI